MMWFGCEHRTIPMGEFIKIIPHTKCFCLAQSGDIWKRLSQEKAVRKMDYCQGRLGPEAEEDGASGESEESIG